MTKNKKNSQEEKIEMYSLTLANAILKTLREEKLSNGKLFSDDLLEDDESLSAFFHALSNLAPLAVFNHITEEEFDLLDFNYQANRLIFTFEAE